MSFGTASAQNGENTTHQIDDMEGEGYEMGVRGGRR